MTKQKNDILEMEMDEGNGTHSTNIAEQERERVRDILQRLRGTQEVVFINEVNAEDQELKEIEESIATQVYFFWCLLLCSFAGLLSVPLPSSYSPGLF